MDDSQQARLFDALLSEAEQWRTSPRAQARRAAEADEMVAADLDMIAALHEVRPARDETEFARARVAQRLAAMMSAESGATLPAPETLRPQGARGWLRAVTAPPAARARRRDSSGFDSAEALRLWQAGNTQPRREQPGFPLRRLAMIAVALMVVAFSLLAGASAASAHALPESPFYGVKLAEENTLLALAWTDDSKGQTLSMIANHRLVEAATEAQQKHQAEAHALLGAFDTTFAQLIDLTASARARKENTSTLTSAIQSTLETEQNIAAQAEAQGNAAFAQAANASADAAMSHITRAGLSLPGKPTQGNGSSNGNGNNSGNGNGNGNGNGSGTGKPVKTPDPQPTHTPHANPGNGKGGEPTPTDTATPAG